MVCSVLSEDECAGLVRYLGPVEGAGRRGLLADARVAALAESERLRELVRPHTDGEPFPVRAIYFDKAPGDNRLVTWHQDLTIALQERGEAEGFGPWSVKDGIPHVHPPAKLLAQMLTVRLHLDAADETNGALRVLAGSHREGRLAAPAIQEWRKREAETLCKANKGDALLMRPLLLHASGRSTSSRHRRVLHIEYASFPLPHGLVWHEVA